MSAATPAPGMTLDGFFEALAATDDHWRIEEGRYIRSASQCDGGGVGDSACPLTAWAQSQGWVGINGAADLIAVEMGLDRESARRVRRAADDPTHPLRPRLLAACGLAVPK